MKKNFNGVLFDLDGTLLDTASDLGSALNHMRQARQLPPLAQTLIRPIVGYGSKALLKLGFNMEDNHPDFLTSTAEFLECYYQTACENSQFFPGVEDVLQQLEQRNIPWGIVTNKPKRFTELLAKHLRLNERAVCIISGDTLQNAKPHPEPILHACKLLGHAPGDCLFVGDAEIDIQACKAAGVPVLAALYGYIANDEKPESWQADGYIKHPSEILAWLA